MPRRSWPDRPKVRDDPRPPLTLITAEMTAGMLFVLALIWVALR
jgi:hypothetical protein